MEFYHGALPSALRYFFSFRRVVPVFSFGDFPISSEPEKNKEETTELETGGEHH